MKKLLRRLLALSMAAVLDRGHVRRGLRFHLPQVLLAPA